MFYKDDRVVVADLDSAKTVMATVVAVNPRTLTVDIQNGCQEATFIQPKGFSSDVWMCGYPAGPGFYKIKKAT